MLIKLYGVNGDFWVQHDDIRQINQGRGQTCWIQLAHQERVAVEVLLPAPEVAKLVEAAELRVIIASMRGGT